MFFFLLFVSEFHQEPELPVPPPSAIAGRPRGAGRGARGRALAAAAALGSTRLCPGLSRAGCGLRAEASGLCWGRKQNLVTGFVEVTCAPIPLPLLCSGGHRIGCGQMVRSFQSFQSALPLPSERRGTNLLLGAAFWSGDRVLALPGFQDRAVVRARGPPRGGCRGFRINQALEGKRPVLSVCPIVNDAQR